MALRKINGIKIKAANTAAVSTNKAPYLITCTRTFRSMGAREERERVLTIRRRCRSCLNEKIGGRILSEGHNQTE